MALPEEEMGTVEFCATISDIVGNCIDVYDGVGEARLATGGVPVVDPSTFVAVLAVLIVYAAVLLVLLVEWDREENAGVADEVVIEVLAVVMVVNVDVGFVLVYLLLALFVVVALADDTVLSVFLLLLAELCATFATCVGWVVDSLTSTLR